MKRIFTLLCILLLLCGCTEKRAAQIAATTLPVYEFTSRLCDGTGLSVTQLITEDVSCLHDYTLKVDQMQIIESAELIILNGAGLEDFLDDALSSKDKHTVDASAGISPLRAETNHGHVHDHEHDPHIWLSPENAKHMARNICTALCSVYPQHTKTFQNNLISLESDLDALQSYGEDALADLSCRELLTFHDGFSYFAHSFDLDIIRTVEEESGSEASASELIELTELITAHRLPAIFTEINGSVSAADILSAETGVKTFSLDMAVSGRSYFDSMYNNIDTIREALQ